jgi:hypothetical protein
MGPLHPLICARLRAIVVRTLLIAGVVAVALVLLDFGTVNAGEPKGQLSGPSPFSVTPEAIKWQPFSPLGPGVERAVLLGNPGQTGSQFLFRLKIPDGHEIRPQWHPVDESITVITGILYLGIGDRFDRSATRELPAGSVAFVPKKLPHFAFTRGETITEVHGIGPFESILVHLAEKPIGVRDPSN